MPYVHSLQWMLPYPRGAYTERENEAPIKGVEEVNNIILSLEWSFYGTRMEHGQRDILAHES